MEEGPGGHVEASASDASGGGNADSAIRVSKVIMGPRDATALRVHLPVLSASVRWTSA
jgi:hypothetical protein